MKCICQSFEVTFWFVFQDKMFLKDYKQSAEVIF